MVKTYALLTKPGIILGNLITAASGFLLVSKGDVDLSLFLYTLLGLSSIIGSGCVFNNYIDRAADEKMARTKERALAKGSISGKNALLFASILLLAGTLILSYTTNLLTASVALTGFLIYVFPYSFGKYRTEHATLIGSLAGATPPVIGYTAAAAKLDAGALLLFLILLFWQMPHFFAIAIYRMEEYAAASIPVLPIKRGVPAAKVQMLLYVCAFILAILLPTFLGFTGTFYLISALALGAVWLWLAVKGWKSQDDKLWARQMFRFSLVVITLLSIISVISIKEA